MTMPPSSEPDTIHFPLGSVVEKDAATHHFAFVCPASPHHRPSVSSVRCTCMRSSKGRQVKCSSHPSGKHVQLLQQCCISRQNAAGAAVLTEWIGRTQVALEAFTLREVPQPQCAVEGA